MSRALGWIGAAVLFALAWSTSALAGDNISGRVTGAGAPIAGSTVTLWSASAGAPSAESQDAVKLGMGLVGTMGALVLGLLVASAKASYDAQSAELAQMCATAVLLDRCLAVYGPETNEARDLLHRVAARLLEQNWSREGGGTSSAPLRAALAQLGQ